MKDPKDAQGMPVIAAEQDCARDAGGDRAGKSRTADPTREADLDALGVFYKRGYNRLHRQAFRILGSADAAHEVVQEAFADTTERINEGLAIRNLGSWLKVVVRYRCLQRLEKRTCLPLDETTLRLPGLTTPAEIVHVRERCQAVFKAAEQLPTAQRSAFFMAELHGFEYREIAAALDRTEHAVRQLLVRARSRVRDAVGVDALSISAPLAELEAVYGQPAGRMGDLRDYMADRLTDLYASIVSYVQRSTAALSQPAEALIAGVLVVAVLGVSSADRRALARGGDAQAPVAGGIAPSPGQAVSFRRGSSLSRLPVTVRLPPVGNGRTPAASPDRTAVGEEQPEPRGRQTLQPGGSDEPVPEASQGTTIGQGPTDTYPGAEPACQGESSGLSFKDCDSDTTESPAIPAKGDGDSTVDPGGDQPQGVSGHGSPGALEADESKGANSPGDESKGAILPSGHSGSPRSEEGDKPKVADSYNSGGVSLGSEQDDEPGERDSSTRGGSTGSLGSDEIGELDSLSGGGSPDSLEGGEIGELDSSGTGGEAKLEDIAPDSVNPGGID